MGLISFFNMWTHNFAITIPHNFSSGFFFFGHFCKISDSCSFIGSCLGLLFCSTGLYAFLCVSNRLLFIAIGFQCILQTGMVNLQH